MPKADQPEELAELLTVPEAAKKLRVDDSTISRWIKEGVMEAIRLPSGRYRIRKSVIEQIINLPQNKNTELQHECK